MVRELDYDKVIISASAIMLVKGYKIMIIRASPTPAVYELAKKLPAPPEPPTMEESPYPEPWERYERELHEFVNELKKVLREHKNVIRYVIFIDLLYDTAEKHSVDEAIEKVEKSFIPHSTVE